MHTVVTYLDTLFVKSVTNVHQKTSFWNPYKCLKKRFARYFLQQTISTSYNLLLVNELKVAFIVVNALIDVALHCLHGSLWTTVFLETIHFRYIYKETKNIIEVSLYNDVMQVLTKPNFSQTLGGYNSKTKSKKYKKL